MSERPCTNASRLMISADGGGSNGYRTRQPKTELATLAADTSLTITVCHLPPGTQCRCFTRHLSELLRGATQ